MTTEKQIAANRRNAARSTGPKTEAGKRIVRMNALRHGLQSEHVVIPGEDPEAFEALLRDLREHYHPVGALEHVLVERITYCTWRLQRANRIETAILRREHWESESRRAAAVMQRAEHRLSSIACMLEGDPDDDDWEENESGKNHKLSADEVEALQRDHKKAQAAYNQAGEAYDVVEEKLKSLSCAVDLAFWGAEQKLEKLSRYETTIERQMRNAMQDLERLQSARADKAAEVAEVIDVTDLNRDAS